MLRVLVVLDMILRILSVEANGEVKVTYGTFQNLDSPVSPDPYVYTGAVTSFY